LSALAASSATASGAGKRNKAGNPADVTSAAALESKLPASWYGPLTSAELKTAKEAAVSLKTVALVETVRLNNTA
jgi:hypothetical protein